MYKLNIQNIYLFLIVLAYVGMFAIYFTLNKKIVNMPSAQSMVTVLPNTADVFTVDPAAAVAPKDPITNKSDVRVPDHITVIKTNDSDIDIKYVTLSGVYNLGTGCRDSQGTKCSDVIIGTLKLGYRPSESMTLTTTTPDGAGGFMILRINADSGTVTAIRSQWAVPTGRSSPGPGRICLDGISFWVGTS